MKESIKAHTLQGSCVLNLTVGEGLARCMDFIKTMFKKKVHW